MIRLCEKASATRTHLHQKSGVVHREVVRRPHRELAAKVVQVRIRHSCVHAPEARSV